MKIRPQVLIVDDDADDKELLRDAFLAVDGEREYRLFDNSEKLFDHLKEDYERPTVIMLDLNMPGMDGRETLKIIKTDDRYNAIPTVVFTTSNAETDRKTAYQLGANCFLTKPDTFDKLLEVVNSILRLYA